MQVSDHAADRRPNDEAFGLMKPVYRSIGRGWWKHVGWCLISRASDRPLLHLPCTDVLLLVGRESSLKSTPVGDVLKDEVARCEVGGNGAHSAVREAIIAAQSRQNFQPIENNALTVELCNKGSRDVRITAEDIGGVVSVTLDYVKPIAEVQVLHSDVEAGDIAGGNQGEGSAGVDGESND